jgi:P-type conjugative transfer protein TrbJ
MRGIIMVKKSTSLVVITLVLLTFAPQKSYAMMPVIDTGAIAKAAAQIENQMAMLKQQALNLLPTDVLTANATMQSIQKSMQSMTDLQNQIQGLPMNLQSLQQTMTNTYKSVADFAGMKPSDLNSHQKQLMDLTNKTTEDAMSAQALLNQNMASNNENYGSLYYANQRAQGALAAQQVSNDIALNNGNIMMQLQQMIAQNNQAQLAQQMQEQQRRQAEQSFSDHIWKSSYTDSKTDPLDGHRVDNTVDKI